MRYSELCEIYESLGKTTKRLEKIDILSKFLKKLSLEDKDVVYLFLGMIYPAYSEKETGISNQTVIKAIAKVSGQSEEHVVKEWKRIGDLGEVAEELIRNKKQSSLFSSSLTTKKVIAELRTVE